MPKRNILTTFETLETNHKTKRRKFSEQKGNYKEQNEWPPAWCKAMEIKPKRLPIARINIIPWTHRLKEHNRTKRSSHHTGKIRWLSKWLQIRARPRFLKRVARSKLKSLWFCHFRSRVARGSTRMQSLRSRGSSRTCRNKAKCPTKTEPLSAWSCRPSDAKRSWKPSKVKRCLMRRRRRTFSALMVDTLRGNLWVLHKLFTPATTPLSLALLLRRGVVTLILPKRKTTITEPARPRSWWWTVCRCMKRMRKEKWTRRCPCFVHSHQFSLQNPPMKDSIPPRPKESTLSSANHRLTETPSIHLIRKHKEQSASSNMPRPLKVTQKLSKLEIMPETSSTTSKVIWTSSLMVTSHRRNRLSNLRK